MVDKNSNSMQISLVESEISWKDMRGLSWMFLEEIKTNPKKTFACA